MVRTVGLSGYSDVHFTDAAVAQAVVAHFQPTGRCLEPFRGGGAFYQHLPPDALWCEVTEGRDFFDFKEPVDWLVTNPPFSNMTEVFQHAFTLAEHCVFLMPISKYWSSAPRLEAARAYGGLREILHLGRGRALGFNTGFPFAALHFQRGYDGPIYENWYSDTHPTLH